MSRLLNFAASLLQKRAYGLDIGGEVHDGGQTNLKDTRYTNTPPNPQQHTTAPSGQTLEDDAVVYCGTIQRLWNAELPTELVVYGDRNDAAIQAQEVSESSVYKDPGLIQESVDQPIVVCVKFVHLKGFDLLPNPLVAAVNWQESYKDSGSFVVSGDLNSIKSQFKLA